MMSKDLFRAIEQHDSPMVVQLLAQGADPNAIMQEDPNWRPLHLAISELEAGGKIDVVRILLEHGADVNAWDADQDITPLLVAIFNGQLQVVDGLLSAGADPNVRNSQGDSPLRVCVRNGDRDTTFKLLRAGATKTINEWGGLRGFTALGLAVDRLDVPMIQLLLDAGADPSAGDTDGKTALDRLPQLGVANEATRAKVEALLRHRMR